MSDRSEAASVADLAALGRLFEEYRPRLLAMIQGRIGRAVATRLDPEDVLHNAFLEAKRDYGRFKQQGTMTPYAWLYRTVLDTLIEAWRRHSRARRDVQRDMPFPEDSAAQLGMGLVHSGTSPTGAVARAELQRDVRKIVELLKENDQRILWMRHQDGLSYREIASVLEISENAAMVRYTRALKRFKELWSKMYPESREEP